MSAGGSAEKGLYAIETGTGNAPRHRDLNQTFLGDEMRKRSLKVALAKANRHQPTPAEAAAWALLRNRRCLGLKFRRQHVIRGFIVDFYCPELRLAVEVDGTVHRGRTQAEYDEAVDHMATTGVPVREDRAQAWRDFAGWRVNYDTALLALAELTLAPYAPWSSDRGVLQREQVK